MKPIFADYYPLETARACINSWRAHPEGYNANGPVYNAWRESHKPHDAALESAIGAFLTAMRDAQLLSVIPFAERRGHRWANPWNRFVQGAPTSWDMATIVAPFRQIAGMAFMRERRQDAPLGGVTPDIDARTHANLVRKMDDGRFDPLDLNTDLACDCDSTGTRLHIDIAQGWKPSLGVFNVRAYGKGDARDSFTALDVEAPLPAVISHQIPAPSGEILIADWFRLDDNLFTKIVKAGAPETSINFGYGRAELTAFYAKEFGFMSVEVGNSSPGILACDDYLVLGYLDEDALEDEDDDNSPRLLKGKFKGRVCTDLWWVTAVDREVLINIIATKLGAAQARVTVDNYVAKAMDSGDMNIVRVPPGVLHFHSTAQRDDLADFECAGPIKVDFDAVEPYLVISSTALQWKPSSEAESESQGQSRTTVERG